MLKQFQLLLGPARIRAIVVLLAVTGLLSLILNVASQETWVTSVQTGLVLVFVLGALGIIGSALSPEARLRWAFILAPAIGAVVLGLTVLPHLLLPLLGGAVGWIIAGAFLFRQRAPQEYTDAIKHLRKSEYEQSINSLNQLIKQEPHNLQYYRLRAEVFRLWGKLDRALKDYRQMTEKDPASAVGHNGIAEVHLQSGRYAEARQAAEQALALEPEAWVAAYNLGMIEDRLNLPQETITHLQQALNLRVPDARHRLLIYLYLARAYARLNDTTQRDEAIAQMQKNRGGLEEWQNLLSHEEAAMLRVVLEADIEVAQGLLAGTLAPEALV
jgi:predicted Zn-dependent protease